MRTTDASVIEHVMSYLEAEVQKGRMEPGSQIPPETEISRRFNVSRYQVRDAMRELVNRGYVKRIKGKGTFVNFTKYNSVWQFKSVTMHPAREHNPHLNPRSQLTNSYIMSPDLEIRRALNLDFTEEAYVLEVTRFLAERPYNYTVSYLPVREFPDLLDRFNGTESLHTFLETAYDIEPNRNAMTLETVMPDDHDVEVLHARADTPLFVFHSVYTCENGRRPLEYRVTRTRGDMCKITFAYEKE